jgi:hypothetical protein
VSVAVGLDAAFDPGQLPVGQQLRPPAQVETPLFVVDRQLERQHRHAATLFDPAGPVNLWFGLAFLVTVAPDVRRADATTTNVVFLETMAAIRGSRTLQAVDFSTPASQCFYRVGVRVL